MLDPAWKREQRRHLDDFPADWLGAINADIGIKESIGINYRNQLAGCSI